MHRSFGLGILALVLSASAGAVPLNASHQGRLFDDLGDALDGSHDVIFTLYDDATSGNELWTEAHIPSFDNGYFHVILGESTPLDEAVLAGDAVFLSLEVDGTVLADRIAFTSVPYAVLAGGLSAGSRIDYAQLTNVPQNQLNSLGCDVGEVPQYDGLAWGCAAFSSDHDHDAADVISGLLNMARLPVGTALDQVAAGDHVHELSDLSGVLIASQLPQDLSAGTTVGGQAIATVAAVDTHAADAGAHHAAYTNADAVAAMGGLGANNPLNHAAYSDADAISAMGSEDPRNTLNHGRYADLDAVGAMGSRRDSNPLNHDRFSSSEAVASMGSASDSNSLNHNRFSSSEAVTSMGVQGDSNALNHERYTDIEARAASNPTIVRVGDRRGGCPGNASANSVLMEHTFDAAETIAVTVRSDIIRVGSGRHDLMLHLDGSVVDRALSYTSSYQWEDVHVSWSGEVTAGTHTFSVHGGTANAWGCGSDWGSLELVIYD